MTKLTEIIIQVWRPGFRSRR